MSAADRPRLVFIHGTSGYKKPKTWLGPLNSSLEGLGIDGWDAAEVPRIKYKRLLKGPRDGRLRRSGLGEPSSKEARKAYMSTREALAAHLADLHKTRRPRLGALPPPVRRWGAKYARAGAFKTTAERYRRRREQVCDVVREAAGPGELIVIGYSLGSVVAADLLSRLAPDQHVRLLITVGSPLGAGSWDATWDRLKRFPYDRVGAWVNIHNTADPVTGWVGLSRREVVDIRIGRFPRPTGRLTVGQLKKVLLAQHKVGRYTGHKAVAAAIGWALEDASVESSS